MRKFLDGSGCENVRIIAKIETADGLRNIDEIIEEADGIMLARGNLGMSIPPEKVTFPSRALIFCVMRYPVVIYIFIPSCSVLLGCTGSMLGDHEVQGPGQAGHRGQACIGIHEHQSQTHSR